MQTWWAWRRGGRGGLLATVLVLHGCAGMGPHSYRAGGEVFSLEGLGEQRAEVVVAALSQLGTPYVYGGSTPGQALDCSALSQYAHTAAGVHIPRVSTQQQAAATPVRGARPGDLVFFQTGVGQYHVGVMVDAKRFVHASTSTRRVRLASLDRPYWRQRFLGAGTYLN